MERNKINFVTGETYTLAELFSGNRRIIIPDLQRDYCWGDETNKKGSGAVGELVTDFINNLIEQYEDNHQDSLNLGLFYGYEMPENHIQLCDGQQRLTTLYLLLDMINKKTDNKFRQHLISDFEYREDDKEPYLNYAIRESSLYFLSDLVCRFFISNDDPVEQIKKSDWYFNDYNLDPSICSMLNALKKIEELLADRDSGWMLSFGDWLLNKLTFLYFDMETRKNGEETFVIINTTGEPLSATQNLKPLVIYAKGNKGTAVTDEKGDKKSIDKAWEEIETWFWKNRQGENDTADAGFAEFLRWVSIIELKDIPSTDSEKSDEKHLIQQILKGEGKCDFPYDKIPFEKIYGYWMAIEWIMGREDLLPFNKEILSPYINGRKSIGQNECFVLLPVLSFVYKYIDSIKTDKPLQRNVKRVYEFFTNLIRIDNVSKSVNSLVHDALLIIDKLEDDDIVSILESKDISESILTEEEKCKLTILKNSDRRNEIEETFWDIQKHPIWSGEIMPILKCTRNENGEFDFDRFRQYVSIFRELFPGEAKHDEITCLLRRCVILCPEPAYQPAKRGYYYSFGWNWDEWNHFLSDDNSCRMKHLFEYVIGHKQMVGIKEILAKFIEESATKNEYIEFAKDDYLISFTKKTEACDMSWGENDWQICTSGGTGRHTSFFSRKNAYILKEYGASYENASEETTLPIEIEEWGVWYWSGNYSSNCAVFQCDKHRIKLDVRYHSSNVNDGGTLEMELKTTDNKLVSKLIHGIKETLVLNEDPNGRDVITKEFSFFDVTAIKEEIELVMSKLNTLMTDSN